MRGVFLQLQRFRSAAAKKRAETRFEAIRCIGWLGLTGSVAVLPGRNYDALLFLARIVSQINEVDACWSGELDLYDRLLVARPDKGRKFP
jgi:hypothetical protein